MFRGSRRLWVAIPAMLVSGLAWSSDFERSGPAAVAHPVRQAQPAALNFGSPLSGETLDQHRAGESKLQLNLNDVKASLEDNKAINTINGMNVITGEAFGRASGLPLAVQNSGNNVIIQNSFILNLDMR